ncbi:LysR family transcriptional regulator [Roseobacter sp. CCS2]|uniref:LysR family transcriptional regulator n=1 Tax=Roseobacter sp. CCS2 TaxID=391593 RepID=UPI0000F3E2FC|nr:LysR family transcriptional regulator [Roseobacter sp. CCS2]EBA12227.1 transcriptional regulator, LysR family, putative [Roseobacter sp. CCS2]
MHLQWLDDVLVLLEEGNLSRAAARRNITQPAFSRRISGFENWLGVTVLERGTNRVEISPSLLANEEEIRALIARLRELRTRIGHFDASRATVEIAAQHAATCSTFPDMALRAKSQYPGVQFRIRAGNLHDCVSMFLRGDTSMLLCYEAESAGTLQFGPDIRRGLWGHDYLVPVVGGALRYKVRDNGDVPMDTPAIVYPADSYFGQVLQKGQRPFGTAGSDANPFSVTAFSSGTREMVLKGLGVGWLPFSMVYQEIESGALISLANQYGQERLQVAIYADCRVEMAKTLMDLWVTQT